MELNKQEAAYLCYMEQDEPRRIKKAKEWLNKELSQSRSKED